MVDVLDAVDAVESVRVCAVTGRNGDEFRGVDVDGVRRGTYRNVEDLRCTTLGLTEGPASASGEEPLMLMVGVSADACVLLEATGAGSGVDSVGGSGCSYIGWSCVDS